MKDQFNVLYEEYDGEMECCSSDTVDVSSKRHPKCPSCHQGIMADCKPYGIMLCINCGNIIDRSDYNE